MLRARFLGVGAAIVLVAASARATPVKQTVRVSAESNMSGGRTALTEERGADVEGRMGALSWTAAHAGWGYEDLVAVRHVTWSSLGAGPRGIEGGIGLALHGGLRAPSRSPHAFVLRGGVEGALFGNKLVYHSILELPQIHAGYQYLVNGTVVEIAAKSGWILLGRHDVGIDGRRVLDGSPEAGAIAAVIAGPLLVRGGWAHVFVRDDAGAVDLVDASVCGVALPIVLCTDVRWERGDVYGPTSALLPGARSSYVGLTIGRMRDENQVGKKR